MLSGIKWDLFRLATNEEAEWILQAVNSHQMWNAGISANLSEY